MIAVTGASAGIGRATVERFARTGARIGLIARGKDRLEQAAAEVERLGGQALVLPLDVVDEDAVDDAAAQIEGSFGPIEVWVNSAMATTFARVTDITPEEFRRATEVTYLGYVWGTLAALRRMVPRDRGTIVQVGSALAYRAIPLQAPYCAAKHAVKGFTQSLRTELLHDGSNVRLTMVELPAHNTPQFSWGRAKLPRHPQPVPPIFQPEVAAQAIVHAAEHPRREVIVGWPAAKAIFGERLAPWVGDLFLASRGVEAQQTEEPLDGERPGNLFEPVPGDFGARGRFDAEAKERSWLLEANLRRGRLVALAAAALGAGLLAVRRP